MTRRDPGWPGVEGAIEFAQHSLMMEPCEFLLSGKVSAARRKSLVDRSYHIERSLPVGQLVKRFAIPMPYCPPMNVLLHKHWSAKGDLHKKIYSMLIGQCEFRKPAAPLGGRPMVRFVRFSVQPKQDRDASWTKVPLDVMQPDKTIKRRNKADSIVKGLGFIADDNNEAIDLRAWWEPGDKQHQFVYADIWTGEADGS